MTDDEQKAKWYKDQRNKLKRLLNDIERTGGKRMNQRHKELLDQIQSNAEQIQSEHTTDEYRLAENIKDKVNELRRLSEDER